MAGGRRSRGGAATGDAVGHWRSGIELGGQGAPPPAALWLSVGADAGLLLSFQQEPSGPRTAVQAVFPVLLPDSDVMVLERFSEECIRALLK